MELASARFVAQHEDLLLIGPPGVGKSHLSTAIAIGAIRAGYRVTTSNIFTLADQLLDAEATHGRRELVGQLSMTDLFVLEDFGMKTLRASAAEDLLDIIMRRHERLPTLITTNRPTEDWAKFLNDVPAATAILDRFLQHLEIIVMEGRSYRLANRLLYNQSAATAEKEQQQQNDSVREPLRSPITQPDAPGRPGTPSRKRVKRARLAPSRAHA